MLEMGYGRLELAAAVVGEGLRPLLPKPCPPAYAQLMAACWAKDPAGRPTFEAVIRSLEQIVQGLGTWEQEQQAMQAVGLGKGIGGQGTDVVSSGRWPAPPTALQDMSHRPVMPAPRAVCMLSCLLTPGDGGGHAP